jgi:hypothetical protein
LQSSEFLDLRQNTANFKLNYGLPHHLELDLTRPIFPSTAPVAQSASGMGDANPGIKWNLRLAAQNSHLPHWEQAYISNSYRRQETATQLETSRLLAQFHSGRIAFQEDPDQH